MLNVVPHEHIRQAENWNLHWPHSDPVTPKYIHKVRVICPNKLPQMCLKTGFSEMEWVEWGNCFLLLSNCVSNLGWIWIFYFCFVTNCIFFICICFLLWEFRFFVIIIVGILLVVIMIVRISLFVRTYCYFENFILTKMTFIQQSSEQVGPYSFWFIQLINVGKGRYQFRYHVTWGLANQQHRWMLGWPNSFFFFLFEKNHGSKPKIFFFFFLRTN